MARKILILNGSPRLNGNTHALIEKLVKGLNKVAMKLQRLI